MRIPCSDVLVSSSDLGIGLFQQQNPMQSSFRLRISSPDLVILVNWKVIIDDYLFGFAMDADVQSIDSLLIVVIPAEDVPDVA